MKFLISLLMVLGLAFGEDAIFKELDELGKMIGQENSDAFKGLAYENGDPSKGIKQDREKSIKLFYNIFQKGSPLGAFKIGFLYWELESSPENKEKQILIKKLKNITGGKDDPSYFFDKGSKMRSQERYKEMSDLLGVVNGVYLFLHDRGDESIKALTQRKEVQDRPESQLYLAFNYLKLKDFSTADFFLNKACNNPRKTESVVKLCSSNKVTTEKRK